MLTPLVQRQVASAKGIVDEVEQMLSYPGRKVDSQSVATLTAAILISAQLQGLAENVNCDKIAEAIARNGT